MISNQKMKINKKKMKKIQKKQKKKEKVDKNNMEKNNFKIQMLEEKNLSLGGNAWRRK